MIGPSRRRAAPPPHRPLQAHRRYARRRDLDRRLARAAVAALAVSLTAWLADAPLLLHAALVLAAGGVALAWPTPGARDWSLAWIAGRSGLAYETALERAAEGEGAEAPAADPYGLRASLAERALAAERRLEPPESSGWWLPVLALALGLLLMPAAGLLRGGPAAGPPVGGPPAAAVPAPGDEEAEGFDEIAPEVGTEPQAERVVDPLGGAGAEAGAEADGDGAESAPSDREALERFVDNLRRRPRGPEEAGAAAPTGRPGPGGEPPEDARRQPGSPEGGRQGEDGEGEEAGERGAEGDGGEGEQEAGASEAGAEGEGTGDDAERLRAEGRPQDAPSDDPGTEGQQGDGGDDDRLSEEEGGPGGGAGREAGAELGSERPEGAPEGPPELLEGALGPGAETTGGAVRLPGSVEGPLPPGAGGDAYRRAVERAVTEGRIPVEYQEIIRNYFR